MVQRKLAYADVNGRKRQQSSTMLNFQGQRKLTLAFQPIRKASQGHREPMHCSAIATHGRIRWPVYTSVHGVTCAGTRLLLLCNIYAQRERLRPLTDARSINPALVKLVIFAYFADRALNSLRPRLNRRPFAEDIFKCIFWNENEWISPWISLRFVPKVRINNITALVQIMAWRWSGGNPLPEPMMVSLLTHICVTRPQWVKHQNLMLLTSIWDLLGSLTVW